MDFSRRPVFLSVLPPSKIFNVLASNCSRILPHRSHHREFDIILLQSSWLYIIHYLLLSIWFTNCRSSSFLLAFHPSHLSLQVLIRLDKSSDVSHVVLWLVDLLVFFFTSSLLFSDSLPYHLSFILLCGHLLTSSFLPIRYLSYMSLFIGILCIQMSTVSFTSALVILSSVFWIIR